MGIEDYKTEIHKLVDEIMEIDLIIPIFAKARMLRHNEQIKADMKLTTKKIKHLNRRLQTKYIKHSRCDVYAIYYRNAQTIYYNLNFKGTTQLIIYK